MCSFCGELRGRSAGVGPTLTGVPALPEGGGSQCTKRKPSSNVRREMLSENKSAPSENFHNEDSGLCELFLLAFQRFYALQIVFRRGVPA